MPCRTETTNPSSSAARAQKDLGLRLRHIRKDAGLTARRLATATGQHFTRVSKIENGGQATRTFPPPGVPPHRNADRPDVVTTNVANEGYPR